jgi:GNAT superfamily N-acetyltransferase
LIVRPGTAADVPSIVAGTVEFAKTAYPSDRCDRDHIASVVHMAMDSGLVCVMESGNDFAAAFVGAIGANPLTGNLVLAEIIVWVAPKFRGHGRKLMAHVEGQAAQRGCLAVALSRPEGFDRVGRLFEVLGYVPTERWYRKVFK